MEQFDGADPRRNTRNEQVLTQGEYGYTRDNTTGIVKVVTGPAVVQAQAQAEPVIWTQDTGLFQSVTLDKVTRKYEVVPTGHYFVMNNPSKTAQHPESGKNSVSQELRIGQRTHIPGPATFALWPRQYGEVIQGHHLRTNQYLLVRVYDEVAAKENWGKGIIKKVAPATSVSLPDLPDGDTEGSLDSTSMSPAEILSEDIPEDLSVGKLLVIQGTNVSFYIPPTGVEVVKEGGAYVRNALTLERMQYCILIGENGNKRYVRGPEVVFPRPTEKFHTNSKKEVKFSPIELNGPIQGVHIKVIADYTDDNGDHGKKGKSYTVGDELFITGTTTPIYFPCEQHYAVKYDGRTRHFATAIPAGDGRYVMDRHSGKNRLEIGGDEGTMCLPDPRSEVFVRRALTDGECNMMYPGNREVLDYNKALREMQGSSDVEQDGMDIVAASAAFLSDSRERGGSSGLEKAMRALRSKSKGGGREMYQALAEESYQPDADAHTSNAPGDSGFSRGVIYTEPRTITLGGDKFAGVPKINIYNKYAVLVVDARGNRRVEMGPRRVLLKFDETLEALSLSTGKPKTTDRLFHTAYLNVEHNKVSDVVRAETSDMVPVEIKLSIRVNFEGKTAEEMIKWFGVSNYVKLLCDHIRSVLKGALHTVKISDFTHRAEAFIRDTILGTKPEAAEGDDGVRERSGMFFTENNMRVYDVEVLTVSVGDETIQQMLVGAQHEVVQQSIELSRDERRLEATKRREALKQAEAEAKAATAIHAASLSEEEIARVLTLNLARIQATIDKSAKELEQQKEIDAVEDARVQADIARTKMGTDATYAVQQATQALREAWLAKETAARVEQLKAVESGFSESLLALGNQETLIKVAEAMSVQQFVGGKDLVEVVSKVFAGTPLASLIEMVQERATKTLGNGDSNMRPRA